MTIVMQTVSKAQFKSHLLEYLRKVEQDKKPLVVTHAGKPVVDVTPHVDDPKEMLKSLQGTVLRYVDPNEPIGLEDWEALQ